MSWANQYVGLPFRDQGRDRDGCDCWGLARLVYEDQLGIQLPSYLGDYAGAGEHDEVANLITREAASGPWLATVQPQPFDLLIFRVGRFESHVGVRVSKTKMLHMARDQHAKIEDFGASRWALRLIGKYSHAARNLKVQA